MTSTIENLCHEYASDVLFSQELSFSGAPVMIIIYLEARYLNELGAFLRNHGYGMTSRKNEGKHFSLARFELINLSHYDEGLSENLDHWS